MDTTIVPNAERGENGRRILRTLGSLPLADFARRVRAGDHDACALLEVLVNKRLADVAPGLPMIEDDEAGDERGQ